VVRIATCTCVRRHCPYSYATIRHIMCCVNMNIAAMMTVLRDILVQHFIRRIYFINAHVLADISSIYLVFAAYPFAICSASYQARKQKHQNIAHNAAACALKKIARARRAYQTKIAARVSAPHHQCGAAHHRASAETAAWRISAYHKRHHQNIAAWHHRHIMAALAARASSAHGHQAASRRVIINVSINRQRGVASLRHCCACAPLFRTAHNARGSIVASASWRHRGINGALVGITSNIVLAARGISARGGAASFAAARGVSASKCAAYRASWRHRRTAHIMARGASPARTRIGITTSAALAPSRRAASSGARHHLINMARRASKRRGGAIGVISGALHRSPGSGWRWQRKKRSASAAGLKISHHLLSKRRQHRWRKRS